VSGPVSGSRTKSLSPALTPWDSRGKSIKINGDVTYLEIDGRAIASARERANGWWEVSHWRRFFDRDRAITALTVTELLHSGRGHNDPLVRALREELQ
jgi:hypothetical protein